MFIALIGMSGTGKTHWSKQLRKQGFLHICCDELIENKLAKDLKKYGYHGLTDVGRWMGQPFDKQYKKNSQKYLMAEEEVIKEIVFFLLNAHNEINIVVDTTGSAIYIDKTVLNKLKALTSMIYLEVSQEAEQEMYEQYIREPKPVIWGNNFKKNKGETNIEALTNSYYKLLKYRKSCYEMLADTTLHYDKLRMPNFNSYDFLKSVIV